MNIFILQSGEIGEHPVFTAACKTLELAQAAAIEYIEMGFPNILVINLVWAEIWMAEVQVGWEAWFDLDDDRQWRFLIVETELIEQ